MRTATKQIARPPSRLGCELALLEWHHRCGHIVPRSFDYHISLGSSPSDGRYALCTPPPFSHICRVDAGVGLGKGVSRAAFGGRAPARPPDFKRFWSLTLLRCAMSCMRVSNGWRQPPGWGSRRAMREPPVERQVRLLDARADDKGPSCHSSVDGRMDEPPPAFARGATRSG